jgi:hypothetical protein
LPLSSGNFLGRKPFQMRKSVVGQRDAGIFLLGHNVHSGFHRNTAFLDGLWENGKHLVHRLVTCHVNTAGCAELAKIGASSVVTQHRFHSSPSYFRFLQKKGSDVGGGVSFLAVFAVTVDNTQSWTVYHGFITDFAADAAARYLSFGR